MERLKWFFGILSLFFITRFIIDHWTPWIVPIALVVLAAGIWIRERIARSSLLKSVNGRVDSFYLVEAPDGRPVFIDGLEDIIISFRKRSLVKTVKWYNELIKDSGNKFGIEVFVILFKDGEYCNETIEEYIDRIRTTVHEDRSKRHKDIKEADPELYILAQHGISERSAWTWSVGYDGGKSNTKLTRE